MKVRLLVAAALGALSLGAASDPRDRLPDPAQEARARHIFRDLRCLVCQNESIDDSEAGLAADLRKLVREQVKAGKSDTEIKAYLTDRYGEFVLMTPRWSAGNLALWLGPFVVVAVGLGLLAGRLRNRTPDMDLSDEEADRLRRLESAKSD